MIAPWQQRVWSRLNTQRQQMRLPHGLLIAGPAGVGKLELARELAAALLCAQPTTDGRSCGGCRSCRFVASGVHPDYLLVQPEEDGKAISVDQVRGMAEFVALTRQQAAYKVVLIAPAERMTVNAANSLLKTLEEPTNHTVLILVSADLARMPATVRSRCQRYDVTLPPVDTARAWLTQQLGSARDVDVLLALCGGAPCAARDLATSGALDERARVFGIFVDVWQNKMPIVDAASVWSKLDAMRLLYWLDSWLMDMARLRAGADAGQIQNPDLSAALVPLAHQVELATLITKELRVREAMRLARGQANAQLLWESLFNEFRASIDSRHGRFAQG